MAGAFLAIELSQRAGSVALRPHAGAAIDESDVPPSDDRADHLMHAVAALFARHGLAPRDLAAIAVSEGPGGFTGLRVACATAMALADATGCRLVAVPSAVVAVRTAVRDRAWLADDGAVATVITASKGSDAWRTIVRVEHGMPVEAEAGLATPASGVVGTLFLDTHAGAAWAAVAPSGVLNARWSAAACLEVGAWLLERTTASERPDCLAPRYPRLPEAVTLWESRHGPGASSR
ncbi:MAG: tRNA (adenosine(37)-N6)-threonylcarbamoyltransferase complex dimerization subunit type 1 TsaB [Phycisphaerales bacterium]|jgi:tRNA threonylcarbamoyladenosine biosynthesis protein TsaB